MRTAARHSRSGWMLCFRPNRPQVASKQLQLETNMLKLAMLRGENSRQQVISPEF